MRKYFLLLFIVSSFSAFCQTNYDAISLKSDDDSRAANKYALEAANYLLSTPYDKNDLQRAKSLQFMTRWMEATPDFSFYFDQTVTEKIVNGNDDLLGYYSAAMTKFSLENKDKAEDPGVVMVNSVKMLLAYCENPKNNLKMPSALQKLSDANKKGELIKALQ
ncbi:hypothetical protein [Flavobacterium sp.]